MLDVTNRPDLYNQALKKVFCDDDALPALLQAVRHILLGIASFVCKIFYIVLVVCGSSPGAHYSGLGLDVI